MSRDTLNVGSVIREYEDEEPEQQYPTSYQVINGKVYKPNQWKPGQSGNPSGKPKGLTMKEWLRNRFLAMNDEERDAYVSGLDKLDLLQMAEGKPSEDKNISITAPTPILGGVVLAQETLESGTGDDSKEADTSII